MGAHILHDEQDVSYTAATDFVGGGALTVPANATKVRVTISATGTPNVMLQVGSQTNETILATLTAATIKTVEFNVKPGNTIKISLTADATIYHVCVVAIQDES